MSKLDKYRDENFYEEQFMGLETQLKIILLRLCKRSLSESMLITVDMTLDGVLLIVIRAKIVATIRLGIMVYNSLQTHLE